MRNSFLLSGFFFILLISFFAISGMVKAASVPYGYWKFDETTAGATAIDSSGNGYDATPQNSPNPSTSVPPAIQFSNPRSINLNGSQYYILNRPIQDSFTICVWAKTLSVGNGYAHWVTAPFLESEVGGLGLDFGFGIDIDGHLTYGNGGSVSDEWVNGTVLIADDNWHHNCVTRNQTTGQVVLYVDGEIDGTGTTNTDSLNANAQAQIGSATDGGTIINGLLDDLRVYNHVLSSSEIAVLASGRELQDTLEEEERVDVDTWRASFYEGDKKCPEKLKLKIKGKHFDNKAEVFLGSKKARSVNVSSSKRLTATFCLTRLLEIKTDQKRNVSVKNPEGKARKAPHKIDLSLFPVTTSLDQNTREGIINIQKILVLKGYLDEGGITGFYGTLTSEAVRKFQIVNGIPPTGMVGSLTKKALLKKK